MTMLEKAARAVQEATSGELSDCQNLRIVRSVLLAVREPDKPLWLAGMAGTNGLRNEITPETVSASFTAMIDAILEEE